MDCDKKIRELIEKYEEGSTTLEEEQVLREFFVESSGVSDDLKCYAHIFTYYNARRSRSIPRKKSRKLHYFQIGIAASVIFLLGVYAIRHYMKPPEVIYAYYNGQPITDRAEAKKMATEAYSLVVEKFNIGIKPLTHLKIDKR